LSYLPASFGCGARQLGAQLRLSKIETFPGEVGSHFLYHVSIARGLEICRDDRLGIVFRRRAVGHTHLRGRPQPEQPVAAGSDPEQQFLVALELGFEPFFAV
jgi:hypothetical protein